MNNIAEMMYSKSEEVLGLGVSPKVKLLEKRFKESLTEDQLVIFLELQDLESDGHLEEIKKAYDCGFKDSIRLIKSLSKI